MLRENVHRLRNWPVFSIRKQQHRRRSRRRLYSVSFSVLCSVALVSLPRLRISFRSMKRRRWLACSYKLRFELRSANYTIATMERERRKKMMFLDVLLGTRIKELARVRLNRRGMLYVMNMYASRSFPQK